VHQQTIEGVEVAEFLHTDRAGREVDTPLKVDQRLNASRPEQVRRVVEQTQ
jgi:hypothetical protein